MVCSTRTMSYIMSIFFINHDLVTNNNKVERMKSLLCMKCRNFISELCILTSNKIHESILQAYILSNILSGISQYLLKENTYTLLYVSAVNQYYHMEIDKSLIISNVLCMTILLPSNIKNNYVSQWTLFILYVCKHVRL